MHRYRCFGMVIHSEIPLPELETASEVLDFDDSDGSGGSGAADLEVVVGPLGPVPADADMVAPGMWHVGQGRRVSVEGVADYLAEPQNGGRSRVLVDAAPGVDDASVRLFLLGTVLGAVLLDRGNLVLHGNAVRIGSFCAVAVGHSGSGKSTLAAEFARREFAVLSDDVVPVTAQGRVLPGYPHIKLWEDALQRLGRSSDGLRRIRPEAPKFSVPITRSNADPVPLRWVFSLESHDGPQLEIVPVAGIEKFALLSEHTYRPQWIRDEAAAWEHAQRCASAGSAAAAWRVRRPASSMTPAATVDAILEHISNESRGIELGESA